VNMDVNYNSRPIVHAWTVAWIIIHIYCSCSGLHLFKKKFKKIHLKKLWFSQIFFYQFFIISGCIFTL
jgi:hypothetical protein